MEKAVRPGRVITVIVILVLILALYGTSLYDLQVVQGSDYYAISSGSTTTSVSVSAARGSLLDRNGILLASSVTSYDVGILRSELMTAEDPNAVLLDMIRFAIDYGEEYTDTMPITASPPFSYTTMDEIQRYRFDTYLEYMELDPGISASDFIVFLKDHYGIDYTTPLKEARLVIGLRYELELRLIVNINPYIFVEDADMDFVTAILERHFPGVNIEKSTKRQYHTKYGAHILGYIGYMNEEEYEYYGKLGYGMNAQVGKDGAEAAFEEYLHGTDGVTEITRNDDGEVIDVKTVTEAQAGSNVYLSMDLGLETVAEKALATTITALNSTVNVDENGMVLETVKATGGAAVAIDVKTGGVLACASYPSYDPATFLDNYSLLVNDPSHPLYNRATMGQYNPGSTFKPCTALTGLRSGVITPQTTIEDMGAYTKYEDLGLVLYCWAYPDTHGPVDVINALGQSCNYYFYTVGNMLGPSSIAETAEEFGLGSPTGIEIPEASGHRATVEYKREATSTEDNPDGEDWYDADTLMDAIGQSYQYYTTLQLANYAATIASGGTRYKLSLLDMVTTPDFASILTTKKPVVNHVIEDPQNFFQYLQAGMRVCATEGTGAVYFQDYKVDVACKTGTTQSDSSSANSGVFICFAPAEDPEIAIAVTVENGKSGATIMTIAKEMLDYYFSESMDESYVYENTLIP